MTPRATRGATATDVVVRIGGLEVVPGGVEARLVTVGLGSCVGVALIDPRSGASGLAHVFLPEAPPSGAKPGSGAGTYAATAVPELVRLVRAASGVRPATRARLLAVLVGGATMFGGGRPGQDIGDRNVSAVTAALASAGVTVVATQVGGSHGRTMHVIGGASAEVRVRQVGGVEAVAWSLAAPAATGAAVRELRRAA